MEVQDLEKLIAQRSQSVSSAMPALMRKVYTWMTLALAITAICAYGTATSPAILGMVYGNAVMPIVLIVATFGLVIYTSARINKLSLSTATTLFVVYSALMGVMLSSIFLIYAPMAIAKTFFITAGTFGAMAVYGSVTKSDLSKWGNLLFMALIGLILASLVNVFLRSAMFDMVVSYIGVAVFVGLTAWDSQQIKRTLALAPDMGEAAQKMALLGALNLYLDFINLFLYLLRIFGGRNN